MKREEKELVIDHSLSHLRRLIGAYEPKFGKKRQDRMIKELIPLLVDRVNQL